LFGKLLIIVIEYKLDLRIAVQCQQRLFIPAVALDEGIADLIQVPLAIGERGSENFQELVLQLRMFSEQILPPRDHMLDHLIEAVQHLPSFAVRVQATDTIRYLA